MSNYHVWHDAALDGQPAFSTTVLPIPALSPTDGDETKAFQSLRNDMAQLRSDAVAKSIADASVIEVGVSTEGRELWALKIGKGGAQKILITGCHHAREWISVEVPFLLAKFLIDNYKDAPSTDIEKRVKHLVDNREIWFVPLVNPDGHVFSVISDRMWRANRRTYNFANDAVVVAPQFGGGTRNISVKARSYTGVDINRNYPTTTWGQETWQGGHVMTSRDPQDSGRGVWAGPSAGSEIETQQIVSLMAAQNFRASLTYHNFSQLLLFPSAATADRYVQFVGKGMESLINDNGNPYTYEAGNALYPTTGDLMEYSYEVGPGRPTFTPEVRPAAGASRDVWFNGLPETEIEPTFHENLGAALALINCAAFDAVPDSVTVKWTPGTAVAQVVRNGWKVFQGFNP